MNITINFETQTSSDGKYRLFKLGETRLALKKRTKLFNGQKLYIYMGLLEYDPESGEYKGMTKHGEMRGRLKGLDLEITA